MQFLDNIIAFCSFILSCILFADIITLYLLDLKFYSNESAILLGCILFYGWRVINTSRLAEATKICLLFCALQWN